MQENFITFTINAYEKLIISSNESSFLNLDDDAQIEFHGDISLILADDCFMYLLNNLQEMLNKGVAYALPLHESIQEDIGLLWNKLLYAPAENFNSIVYYESEGRSYWIGDRYSLWEAPSKVQPNTATWLYNDEEGNVILKITPVNRLYISNPGDYAPYVERVLSPETTRRWLSQINMLKQID